MTGGPHLSAAAALGRLGWATWLPARSWAARGRKWRDGEVGKQVGWPARPMGRREKDWARFGPRGGRDLLLISDFF